MLFRKCPTGPRLEVLFEVDRQILCSELNGDIQLAWSIRRWMNRPAGIVGCKPLGNI
jgi:hypothetical protein